MPMSKNHERKHPFFVGGRGKLMHSQNAKLNIGDLEVYIVFLNSVMFSFIVPSREELRTITLRSTHTHKGNPTNKEMRKKWAKRENANKLKKKW